MPTRSGCTKWRKLNQPRPVTASLTQLVSYLGLLVATNLLIVATSGAIIGQEANQSNSKNVIVAQAPVAGHQQHQQRLAPGSKAALEAELDSILQQHDTPDANSKLLSEAIISRLMLGNLSEPSLLSLADSDGAGPIGAAPMVAASSELADSIENADEPSEPQQYYSGPEAMRLKKLLSFLHNAEMSQALAQMGAGGALNDGQVFSQYPVLPASQAATIKRASAKMSNYLRQQQQQRQLSGYGRNTFDFGLGKRPDSSVSSNILRFGDSSIGSGSHVQAVSGQLGKRPAHRYDFGLGKRVASVSRYAATM